MTRLKFQLTSKMVRTFSSSNNIGNLPGAIVNYILSLAWIEDVLKSFGLGRLRLTRRPELGDEYGFMLDVRESAARRMYVDR